MKKYRIFSTCVDIANQLLIRHSPLAPLGQVDEWHECLSELSRIMAAKTLKKSVSLTDSAVQTFLKGEKTNTRKEKPKVTYSVALVLAFLVAGNENRQLKDLPLADFGRLPERLLLSVGTKSKMRIL